MSCITAAMLPSLLGRPVAYQPVFARLPGVTVQGAIFLSQALFLCNTPTARKRDGWFWKEQQGDSDSWEAETGMSAKQQVTARRQLVAIGVLEEVRKGVPAKTWYRVNTDVLALRLAEALSDEEVPEPPATPATAHNLPSGESENSPSENQESPEGSAQNLPTGVFLQRLQQRVPPLSDAGASDAPSVFDRAAELDDQGQPLDVDAPVTPHPCQSTTTAGRKAPMTLEWEPDLPTWQRACFDRGLPVDADVSIALIDFREHYAAQPGRTHTPADWTRRFAKWVHENLQRQAARASQSPAATGGDHANRRQRTPARRLTAAEARARDRAARESGSGAVYEGEHHPPGH
ncbi:DnaT-like ssDNA-binding domain-containing protein [Halomonas sp. LES1]|uniref:DnaT-like ssDNA-binding domain-containing protein n=1 Tax=Halomonas sp. LES1 TaxID=3075513 RepID=UPI0028857705|nr:DnaT-like ssDNA-binding domain-containing protein [Halomonas sp. LES1]MDT0510496.1 DnaT-like ssDNA-binding domain-containing protein [Halomonas sp. LES1]